MINKLFWIVEEYWSGTFTSAKLERGYTLLWENDVGIQYLIVRVEIFDVEE